MHELYYEFKINFSATVLIASQLTKPSSVSIDFIFMMMSGSNKNSYHIFSSIKNTLIQKYIIINLQFHITTHTRPLILMQILFEEGRITASQLL
jgi:hypothetical protein